MFFGMIIPTANNIRINIVNEKREKQHSSLNQSLGIIFKNKLIHAIKIRNVEKYMLKNE